MAPTGADSGLPESSEAPPAADTANRFRGSGTIGGPEQGPGIVSPRRWLSGEFFPHRERRCAGFGAEIAGTPAGLHPSGCRGVQRRLRALRPPFSFVLPKENAPRPVEKKSADVGFRRSRKGLRPPRPPAPTVPPRCGTSVKMCDGCVAVLARHQSVLRRTRACLRPPLALPHFSLPHPPPSPAGGNRYALLYHCRQG